MTAFIVKWFVASLVLMGLTYYVPGVHVTDFQSSLIAAGLIGLLNATVRPILKWMTMPLTVLTFGLFYLLVNGATFWLAANFFNGLQVDNLQAAVVAALVYSVMTWLFSIIIDWLFK